MQRSHIKFKLYRLSKMIPIFCMLTFLGILSYAFSVGTIFNYVEQTYAEGESAQSGTVTPQATISIKPSEGQYGAGVDSTTVVGSMGMAYRSHDVTVHAQDVTKYSLNISYADGKDALRLEGGSTYFANVASTGQTPSTMKDNTWGFAWGETTEAEDEMTYYVMPQYGSIGTDLAGGLLASENTYNEDFTKKLVFGAKFGTQNEPGHYKTAVILSLAANAQEVVTTLDDLRYMQDMTPEVCASTKAGENATLQDKRDGSEYVVQKLEDGNCWMLQNLKLTKEGIESWKAQYPDTENNVKLSSKYSNVASDSTFSMPTTIASLSSGNASQFGNSSNYNTTAQIYNGGSKDTKWQEGYGAYYNWYAATAGTGNASVTVDGQDVDASICPKGWRLPTSNKTSTTATGYNYSFNKLVIDPLTGKPYATSNDANYKANAWKSANYTNATLGLTNASGAVLSNGFFPAAGSVDSGSLSIVGSGGRYWSSTAYGGNIAYFLGLYTNNVYPSGNGAHQRYYGLSVRCVAKQGFGDITKMQEMTPEICNKADIGVSKVLIDTRGGGYTNSGTANSYLVQKLEDGNCWMVQNLKLDLDSVDKLTSADSAVSTSWPDTNALSTLNATFTNADTAPYYNNNPSQLSSKYQEKFGYYYNWCAVTAGSCEAAASGSEASASICPKGWRLPTANKTSSAAEYKYSYDKLATVKSAWYAGGTNGFSDTQLGLTDASGYLLSGGFFPAAGQMDNNSLKNVGSNGNYWSSTAGSTGGGALTRVIGLGSYAYYLGFSSSSISATGYMNRGYGFPVRCVAPAS